jgi:prepilin peptidase CpaA
MGTAQLLWIAPLITMLLWAAIVDFRTRRIRNWLTFSMILSGLIQSFFAGNQISPGQSALGFVVGAALPLPLFLLGAIGGGDVKLLAGIGAWLGAAMVFKVFCGEAIIGMMIVLAQATMQGRLKLLARNSAMLAVNLAHVNEVGLEHTTLTGQSCRSVDRPLPFAVPVLLALVGWLILGGRV